ncbi:putative ABC transporter ATP-binding protein YfmR [Pullulanibacillus camelliae]|uniref:Putative ABC transporter ATP-binding protein YfmR n=1 Tax=Pullulanibacillus camelliae TaxID=1707096 RepID=A0A8J2VMT9_9BACL|nr:ABC-F family ATP-binding cassette domain-containing protein [Pullulanibacillus camelliae]GGE29355.1 putative ABC transporter ATP-binding protein YfmR [Pullulanibacillus camelliae]
MSLLIAEDLYKTFGEKTLFDHISLTIEEKERVGLIGVNGTGKSSLLKILAEVEQPETGTLTHAKQFHIEYLPQNPEFHENLTVLEQIYYGDSQLMRTMRAYERLVAELENQPEDEAVRQRFFQIQQQMDALDAWEASTLAKTILNRLGIKAYQKPVNELSGGQRKRVAMAKALIQPADLLILDEPTNHLDNKTIEWLETYLSQYPGALVLVTHDRYFLNRVVKKIYELDHGKLYAYEGNYEVFLEKKAEREALTIQDERKRQNLLRSELAWLRRGAKARSTKQKARIDRVHQLQEQDNVMPTGSISFQVGASRLGNQVLEIEDITKSYDHKTLIKSFSYLVVPGERLGIIGPNGTGKSTLLNMMAGLMAPDSGEIKTGQTVKLGYYRQSDIDIDGSLRVIDYIKEKAEMIHTADGQWISAEQMLERFLFPRPAQRTFVRRLSGGEQRRLYLLKVLMEEPNVLLLDEPTNDLDTTTLSILEDYLDHFSGVVITVSHDRYFLDRVIDHLLVFEGEGNIQRFEGNYSDYLASEKSTPSPSKHKQDSPQFQGSQRRQSPRLKLTYKEQKEWEGIEERIAELEAEQERLEGDIQAAGSDLGRVQELFNEQKEIEVKLEEAVERWTELSIKVEEIERSKR